MLNVSDRSLTKSTETELQMLSSTSATCAFHMEKKTYLVFAVIYIFKTKRFLYSVTKGTMLLSGYCLAIQTGSDPRRT